MSEHKPPISQMMSELEMRADKFNPEKFSNQAEQIRIQVQEKMLNHFIDVFCTIYNAVVHKDLELSEGESKGNQLLDLALDKLSESEYMYVAQMTRLLGTAQYDMSQFKEGKNEAFNIYKETLSGNLVLPTLVELSKAKSFGFHNLIIVPGEKTIKEIAASSPNYFDILIEDPVRNDRTLAVDRPTKFYTLALQECKEATDCYPSLEINSDSGSGWLKKVKQEFKRDNLNVTGLTIKEYIYLQFYVVNEQISQGLPPDKIIGFDSDSKCVLLDDENINSSTGRNYPTIGQWFDNRADNRGVRIIRAAHMEGWKVSPKVGARLAVNFSGGKNA